MNEVEKKAYEDADKYTKRLDEFNPGDWSNLLWEEAVKYWGGKELTHRSIVATQNRKKLRTKYNADARAFAEMEEVKTWTIFDAFMYMCVLPMTMSTY